MYSVERVRAVDPQVADAISAEVERQRNKIELIASENFVSEAVLEAAGTPLTNKYAEGYPGRRYYGGCEHVDVVESLAISRACELFGAEHANVQPHSGSSANMAVYFSVLKPGDTILGMDLSNGGHLSHGSPVNISGKYFNVVSYKLSGETHLIDYDAVLSDALKYKPKMIVAGASAYPRFIDFEKFSQIAKECGALFMADIAHIAGLVACGLHPSPVPYADFVTTTTHKTLRGPRSGLIMCKERYASAIDKAVFPGLQGGPLMHIIAAKAVCLKEAMSPQFKDYQKLILSNAKTLADALIRKGFNLVTGGTDNHLMLVDLRSFSVTGKELSSRLDEVGITVNKNTVPNDPEGPFVTSGVRIGTAAVSTRGMSGDDMEKIAELIHLATVDFENKKDYIKSEVSAICAKYKLYE